MEDWPGTFKYIIFRYFPYSNKILLIIPFVQKCKNVFCLSRQQTIFICQVIIALYFWQYYITYIQIVSAVEFKKKKLNWFKCLNCYSICFLGSFLGYLSNFLPFISNYKIMFFFSFSFRSIVNEGPNEFLSVRAPLYLAGVPEQTGTKAWKQWHLRNTTSFIGESYFLSFARKSKKFVKSRY